MLSSPSFSSMRSHITTVRRPLVLFRPRAFPLSFRGCRKLEESQANWKERGEGDETTLFQPWLASKVLKLNHHRERHLVVDTFDHLTKRAMRINFLRMRDSEKNANSKLFQYFLPCFSLLIVRKRPFPSHMFPFGFWEKQKRRAFWLSQSSFLSVLAIFAQ